MMKPLRFAKTTDWNVTPLRDLPIRTTDGTFQTRKGDNDGFGHDMGLFVELYHAVVQNFVSVFGLSFFIIFYVHVFLGVHLFSFSLIIYLLLTVVGLAVFGDGLRQGFMPLGEAVGARLPKRVPLFVVLLVVLLLGILCTIAEPAIAALEEAGSHTNRQAAPLLALILDQPIPLMMSVGSGVGVASVFGCARLIFDLRIKTCLTISLLPALAITFVCQFIYGGPFVSITGLSWDCGAVTTGPVTVPIVLALGIGIAASTKAQTNCTGKTSHDVDQETPAPEEGIIERRHSLPPNWRAGMDSVSMTMAEFEDAECEYIAHLLRMQSPLPEIDPIADDELEDDGEVDLSGFGIVAFASLFPVITNFLLGSIDGGAHLTADDAAKAVAASHLDSSSSTDSGFRGDLRTALMDACRSVIPLAGFLLLVHFGLLCEKLARPLMIFRGLVMCFGGMFIFNLGLFGGLVPLGQGAGHALPKAIDLYGPNLGPVVMFSFGFLVGMGATFSEPALAALGATVERLTKGKFKKATLIFAVAFGVGFGIALGFAKVYYGLDLWTIIIVGYSICLGLTMLTEDAVVCLAWDSAGVTTGPVTVPIVLASGLALSEAVGGVEGFGILTCASIGPILAVLITGTITMKQKCLPPASSWRGLRASIKDDAVHRLSPIRQQLLGA